MLDRGATLMVSNLHQWHTRCREICATSARALRARIGASAFYTPANCDGLVVHRDDAHVFVVQVTGTKRWVLYDVPSDPRGWSAGRATGIGSPEMTVELKPGEALYVPMGQAHHTHSLADASLHLSITVREPRLRDMLSLALDHAMADVPAHGVLSGGSADRVELAASAIREVAARLAATDPETLVAALEQRIVNEQP